jgi:ferrous iron transport protein A
VSGAGREGAPAPAARPSNVTLADLAKGDRGRIETLEGAGVVAQRLLEMGLTPGAVVTVVRFAPLGDPIEVKVRGYALSLRREDARAVRVVPVTS